MVTIEIAKKHYIEGVRIAAELNKYCKDIASFLGTTCDVIANSPPVKHWLEFARNVDRYADKWERNLKAAFGLA